MPNREFRKIPSLNFLYEVSEDGRIFRNVKSKKQLKIIVDYHHTKKGYCKVTVNKGKFLHKRHIMIAHVVAECWLGKRPEGLEVDHIDRNTLNNHWTNLRYVTRSEQMKNRDHTRIIENIIIGASPYRMKPVILANAEGQRKFESLTSAARFLSETFNKPVETMCNRFKARRKHIYDYDVIYLNVETERVHSKE